LTQINERGEAMDLGIRAQPAKKRDDRVLSSAVHTFTDPDDYAAAVRGTEAQLTITGQGRLDAKFTRIDLHSVWMLRCSENLPRVGHYALAPGRAVISFRTQPGPRLLVAGSEMHLHNLIRHSDAQEYFRRSSGFASYGSMSLPIEEIASVGAAVAGCDLMAPRDMLSHTPEPLALAKLRDLHVAAGQLAEHAPAVIAHPEAARGLEQALIEAMVGCLGIGEVGEDRAALRQHAVVMRRFRAAVEENPEQALFIPEICTAIGVSHRTLQVCCQEQLGVSPKRYLLLRRMHLARGELRDSAPTATTVTEVAARYGFWEFGRFAGKYKSLFGELPSTTS
jgi:AraC-like DNA-binding protein